MTDSTATPPAASAAPGAAAPATPPAAPPATPPATPPAADPPAADPPVSLLPPADKVEGEAADPPAADPPAPIVNQDESEWFLSDGVKGEGKAPEWFRADKYKTVAEQAKAYPELAKLMGAFTGAPKDGKYEIKLPDGLDGTLDVEHPLLQTFQKWAGENQMSLKAFNEVVGMLAAYEAELAPDAATVKAQMGENADARINTIAKWAKANLALDEYEALQAATVPGPATAATLKVIETLIAKSRQPRAAKPGADVPSGQPTGEAAINAAQAKLGPDGKRLYETDPAYRAMVENMRINYYNSLAKAA